MSTATLIQLGVFFALSTLVALVTWLHCRRAPRSASDSKEYFLAGGTLGWDQHIRATVATIILLGSILLYLPVMLYTSSLVLKTMFGLELPLLVLAAGIATAGAAYAIFGTREAWRKAYVVLRA